MTMVKPTSQKQSDKAEILFCSMKIEEFKAIVSSRKGQNLSAIFGRPMKTRKGVIGNVEKVSSVVIRGGIDYDNMNVVKEGREDGTLPAENAGLPWGEWAEFPLHIAHKGIDYARLYPASGLDFRPKVEYYLDGVLVEKSVIEPLCLASEFPKKGDEAPLCYTIKAENLRAILI